MVLSLSKAGVWGFSDFKSIRQLQKSLNDIVISRPAFSGARNPDFSKFNTALAGLRFLIKPRCDSECYQPLAWTFF